ncbi:uncharacterized protein BDZ99DRAFT_569939 [Mytilinidion resinicola]|uniref:Uncharacterized protein n=1 Tax=Mytilinidion resinicola TaxID=574789 RepID=A0A6A6YTY8_9PEZI|nr:uncharacterized protein BDZ99DRAFT_569939 [Mytilinidion resinicola]KAF2812008.1 hypothetical protein BDZ99DRAFT_569939 [Mytilinidion resinicola]
MAEAEEPSQLSGSLQAVLSQWGLPELVHLDLVQERRLRREEAERMIDFVRQDRQTRFGISDVGSLKGNVSQHTPPSPEVAGGNSISTAISKEPTACGATSTLQNQWSIALELFPVYASDEGPSDGKSKVLDGSHTQNHLKDAIPSSNNTSPTNCSSSARSTPPAITPAPASNLTASSPENSSQKHRYSPISRAGTDVTLPWLTTVLRVNDALKRAMDMALPLPVDVTTAANDLAATVANRAKTSTIEACRGHWETSFICDYISRAVDEKMGGLPRGQGKQKQIQMEIIDKIIALSGESSAHTAKTRSRHQLYFQFMSDLRRESPKWAVVYMTDTIRSLLTNSKVDAATLISISKAFGQPILRPIHRLEEEWSGSSR